LTAGFAAPSPPFYASNSIKAAATTTYDRNTAPSSKSCGCEKNKRHG
jgi:hypothetical protein